MSDASIGSEQRDGEIPSAGSIESVTRRALRVLVAFSFVGALLLVGAVRCPVAMIAHVPCPGCGLTRATMALLHGDVRGAFHFHPMVFVALPVLVGFFGGNGWMYMRTGRWGWVESHMDRRASMIALVVLVALIALWISRFFGAFGGPVPVE